MSNVYCLSTLHLRIESILWIHSFIQVRLYYCGAAVRPYWRPVIWKSHETIDSKLSAITIYKFRMLKHKMLVITYAKLGIKRHVIKCTQSRFWVSRRRILTFYHLHAPLTKIVHPLHTAVPPTLRAVPQNGQVAARKGSTVTLECKASGNPVPSIYWFKKVRYGVTVESCVHRM